MPEDARIQPAQAFVDAFSAILASFGADYLNFSVADCGISDGEAVHDLFTAVSALLREAGAGGVLFDLSGNAFDAAFVDGILADALVSATLAARLDLSRGSIAEPTDGAANTNLLSLIAAGWTVAVNISGVPTTFSPP